MISPKKKTAAARAKRATVKVAPHIDLSKLIPGDKLPGGTFAGLVYEGRKVYALILGPEHDGELSWDGANKWAKSVTVDGQSDFTLMSRPAASIAFANLKKEFKPAWYWLGEQHASTSGSAWRQGFNNGDQNYWNKGNRIRARAVRRLAI